MPGGFNESVARLMQNVVDVLWCFGSTERCQGLIIHGVSIVASSDLHYLKYQVDPENIQGPFFHNKYFMEVDHTVMDCMEEQLIIRNKKEYDNDCNAHMHRTQKESKL